MNKKPKNPRLPDPSVTAFQFIQRLTGQPPVEVEKLPKNKPKETKK